MADLAYDPSARRSKGSGYFWYKEVKSSGVDLTTADTFHIGAGAINTVFRDSREETQLYDAGGRPYGSDTGDRIVESELTLANDDFDTMEFFRTECYGKFYAVILDRGIGNVDSTLEKPQNVFTFIPLAKFPASYESQAPGGRTPTLKVLAQNNASAIALTSVTTAISAIISLCNLDSTAAAASLAFAVGAGEIYDNVEITQA